MATNGLGTGEILPRDYGLIISSQGRRLFISPSKYAIGKLMLETPAQIRARLRKKAEKDDLPFDELVEELVAGVKRHHRYKCVLNVGRSGTVREVGRYPITITAQVKSKTRGYQHVSIVSYTDSEKPKLGYNAVNCECLDNRWNEVKGTRFEGICTHLAALEIAIDEDNKSRKRVGRNITGLTPKERSLIGSLPFTFFAGGKNSEALDSLVTDAIWDYYVERLNHFEINKALLANPLIYSKQLKSLFEQRGDKVRFGVVRQKERTIKREISPSENAYLASVRSVKEGVTERLWELGFTRQGYALEFKGTPHEVVAEQFKDGYEVWSLCAKEGMPPIVVHRRLGGREEDWISATDDSVEGCVNVGTNSPFKEVSERYGSVDDATRRIGRTRIIIPGQGNGSPIRVAQVLQKDYDKLLES